MGKRISRSDARKEAFKLIFQLNQHKDELDFLFENLMEELPEAESAMPYIKDTVKGVLAHYDELSAIISEHLAKGWRIERISKPARAILMLAVYEIKYADDVPERVAVNEAVEIAKEFDEPSCAAFINGVLAGVLKQ